MKVYLRFVLSAFLLFSNNAAQGQTGKKSSIDSLLSELSKYKNDTNRGNILDKLSFAYAEVSPDKGIRYAKELLALSHQLKWQEGIAKANAVMGINYAALSEYEKAIACYNRALEIATALKDSSKIAGNNANISLIYLSQGNYSKALAIAFSSLRVYEALNDTGNTAKLNENIGIIYYDQRAYEKAMQYYSAALQGYKAINHQPSIARCYGNMGAVLGATGKPEQALKNHRMALEANRLAGNKNSMQINLANIGVINQQLGHYAQALENHFEALKISEQIGKKHSSAVNTGNIGETYLSMATEGRGDKKLNLAHAIQYLELATKQCRELDYSGPYVEFSKALSDAYLSSGNYEQALKVYKEHINKKDSLFNIQSKLEIAALEMERAKELKDKDLLISKNKKDISRLEKAQEQSKLLVFLACALAIILLIVFILKSLFAYRKSNRLLNMEKEQHLRHIRSQKELLDEIAHIQAHEVSGPVATILGLVKVFNYNEPSDPANQTVIDGITEVAEVLDEKVKDVIRKKNSIQEM